MFCSDSTSLKTLENCTSLTGIRLEERGLENSHVNLSMTLDLSRLVNATYYYDIYFDGATVILPKNISVISCGVHSSATLDGTYCENLQTIYSHAAPSCLNVLVKLKDPTKLKNVICWGGDDSNKLLELADYLKKCTNLEYIRLGNVTWAGATSRTTVSSLANLSKLSGLEHLNKLELWQINLTDKDYSYVKNLTHLNNFYMVYCNASDVSWISSLTGLTECTISSCLVNSGIKAFEQLKSLQYLNLQYNSLYDLSEYQGTSYSCCETFASLHPSKGGSLVELYLAGNTNMKDFSKVSSLSWTKKSGF